ncbi:MAG: transcription antitermination factor NusB [Armatimonadetes bacterium]|nr:transcription antitermination factor NusB [Armatimonadota bacterium]
MGGRRQARQAAMEVLFQCEVGKRLLAEALEDARERGWGEREWLFIEDLCRGTLAHLRELDPLIREAAATSTWRLERMSAVDRTILRMAVFELRHRDTPSSVVINEAVELAKRYGTEDSGRFVNGVLGGCYRRMTGAAVPASPPGR